MSEKKRKRSGVDEEKPGKKKNAQFAASTIKFRILEDTGDWRPVIASTPGLEAPADVILDAYSKPASNTQHGLSSQLLLHTSEAHAKLDYTAREEKSGITDDLLKHYVGVFDPASGELQLVPARKMVVRGTLRTARTVEEDGDEGMPYQGNAARVILGEAFGTKKSQKAIRALTENAISSLGKNAEGRSVLDASASAILGSLADASSTNPTKEQMQADMDKAKPRPRANLDAEKPEDVYPLETLVGSNMLREVNVKSWTDAVAKGEDVPTTSLFVSRNLVRIVKTKDAKQIKALRALLIMIQWYKGLKPGGREGKKLPKKEDMADAVPGVESRVLDIMRSRFASNAILTRWDLDFVISHICALSLVLEPSYETDLHYLCNDLGLDLKQLTQYFKEIGCKVVECGEKERKIRGLSKAAASTHKIARLRIPLEFPKVRLAAASKRR